MQAWRLWLVPLAACLAACAVPARAGAQPSGRQWLQVRAGELPGSERLVVRTSGDLVVTGEAAAVIRYVARFRARSAAADFAPVRAAFGVSGIDARTLPDGAAGLTLRRPSCEGCRVLARLEVSVPEDMAELDLATQGGDIVVRGFLGAVAAEAAGGSVEMDAIGSKVSATASGRITLGAVGGSVFCKTKAGRIELKQADGPVQLETEVGSVRVDMVSRNAVLRTGAGSIRIEHVGGMLRAETGSGSIQVTEALDGIVAEASAGSIRIGRVGGMLRAETGSGSIQVTEALNGIVAEALAGDIWIGRVAGALTAISLTGNIAVSLDGRYPLRDSVLSTEVGDLFVELPETLAVTVEAAMQMFGGRRGIVSDFPEIRVRRSSGLLGRAEASGSLNGGGALLRLGTRIGRIEIRRQR